MTIINTIDANIIHVIRWAEQRKIIPRSTAMAQAIKTHEELGELLSALLRGDREEIEDAYGDILVTLIIGADLADIDLRMALQRAYNTIKDRKGTLRSDGVFVKEAV
jgi:NTP pyrophosphatase (non-canonical NTP hydrolase)